MSSWLIRLPPLQLHVSYDMKQDVVSSPHQSQGGHHHHHHHPEQLGDPPLHDEEDGQNLDGVLKGLTALGGVYVMFLIEHFLTLGKMYKDKKQKVRRFHSG